MEVALVSVEGFGAVMTVTRALLCTAAEAADAVRRSTERRAVRYIARLSTPIQHFHSPRFCREIEAAGILWY